MKVLIIGGGPSGLMCALEAAKNNNQVFVLEKNEKVGKKIYITGKGRCNVTNNCSVNDFIAHVPTNARFLYSSLSEFAPKDTIEFFTSHGVDLVTERGNRVFPTSYKASDITRCLVKECEKLGVKIYCHSDISSIEKKDDKFIVKYNKMMEIVGDALVIATGGLSYPTTGSTGDGYAIARKFGHNIKNTTPSLVCIKIKDQVSYDAQGLTLKNVALHGYNDSFHHTLEGDLSFEKGVIDGPIVLKLSSLVVPCTDLKLYLDLKMALTSEELDARIVKDIKNNPTGRLKDEMEKLLPIAMIKDFLNRVDLNPRIPLASLKKEDRTKIVTYLKKYRLDFISFGDYSRAIITRGGVDIKEINPKTMESKLVNKLYFVGEVLDVDAFTGGFNMQIAFSTGYTCGKHLLP